MFVFNTIQNLEIILGNTGYSSKIILPNYKLANNTLNPKRNHVDQNKSFVVLVLAVM